MGEARDYALNADPGSAEAPEGGDRLPGISRNTRFESLVITDNAPPGTSSGPQPTIPTNTDMNDMPAMDSRKPLTNQYVPSGRISSSTIPNYLVFTLIGAIAVQIPFGLTEALLGFVFRYSSGPWVVISPILFGAIGFAISGFVLFLTVNIATKRGQCRSLPVARSFIIIATLLAFPVRLLVTQVFIWKLHLGPALGVISVLDMPSPYWIETSIGFVVVLITVLLSCNDLRLAPYCEDCGRYMEEKASLFDQKSLKDILDDLMDFRSGAYSQIHCGRWIPTSARFPSARIQRHTCAQCRDAYIEVFHDTVTYNKKGEAQRRSKFVYGDSLAAKASNTLASAIGSLPGQ